MIRKKPAPHLMRGEYRFSEKIMLKQQLERGDDSKKGHHGLARRLRLGDASLRLRPRVLLGFPRLELLEQRLAVGFGLRLGGRSRALFQKVLEPGARHRFDVVV